MKAIKIGHDSFLKKDVIKISYSPEELPKAQLFNSEDVIIGNPSSNIAIGFVYIWKTDTAPEGIREIFQKISNYAAMTGFWRTTNGARYVFSNILGNPNINKLVLLVFNARDNGHLLVEALSNFWKNGCDENGIIINSKSPNPKFEQVPLDALERLRKQADLLVVRNLSESDYEKIEKIMKALIQEPENSIPAENFPDAELISEVIKNSLLYDDGARFKEPYSIDLLKSAKHVVYEEKDLIASIGCSIQAMSLDDALPQLAAFIAKNGSTLTDQRGITILECRSFSITILNALEKLPEGFSKEYMKRYVDEFLNGLDANLDFAYNYHNRIFRKWGNQFEKVRELLRKHPNTRRAMISLWDPENDLGNENAPCLDFIWAVVRNNKLEFHPVYRSHHLATITKDGKLMIGEGAFVPNLYAIASMQEKMAKELGIERGPLVLTDFSGHLYVSNI